MVEKENSQRRMATSGHSLSSPSRQLLVLSAMVLTPAAVLIAVLYSMGLLSIFEPPSITLTLRPNGNLEVESGERNVRWFCNISAKDETLCRGRADRIRTRLNYSGNPPILFTNKDLMLYRSQGRIIGARVGYYTRDPQTIMDNFAPIMENRRETSDDPDSRACGNSEPSAAINAANFNYNSKASSICADIGSTRITWRFAKPLGTEDHEDRLMMKLTLQTSDLVGSWWF